MLKDSLRKLAAQAGNTPVLIITTPNGAKHSEFILSRLRDKHCASTFTFTPMKSREPNPESIEAQREFRNNWVFDTSNCYFTREAMENAVAKAKEDSPLIYIPGFDPKLDGMVELHGLEAVINSLRKGSYARAKPTGTTEECVKAATENMGRQMTDMHVKDDIPVTPTPHEDTRLTVNIENGAGEAEAKTILHQLGLMGYTNITVNEIDVEGNNKRACGSLRIDQELTGGGVPEPCNCGECSHCKIAAALVDEAKEDIKEDEPIKSPSDGAIYAAASSHPQPDAFQQVFGDIFGDIFGFGKKATPEHISKVGAMVQVTDAAILHLRLPRGVANPEEVGNWDMADYRVHPTRHLSFLAGRYTVSRYWEKYGFVTLVSACEKQHVVKVKLDTLDGIWVA